MPFAQAVPASDGFGPLGDFARGMFLTNRCGNARTPGCNRALTKLEILGAFGVSPRRKSVCPCGCNSWRSSNFKWWEELTPRSLYQWWEYKHGRVAGNPSKDVVESHERAVMEAVTRMVESEEMSGEDE